MTRLRDLALVMLLVGGCATRGAPAGGGAAGGGAAGPQAPVAAAPAAEAPGGGGAGAGAAPVIVVGRKPVVEVVADDAAAKLQAFVDAHPDDPRFTPDALLRLGTLDIDRAERALDADPAAVATLAARAQATLRDARDRFPAYPRRDLILYQLGYASELAGDAAGARDAYQALAAIPGSALADEGWFRLGEQAFLDDDLAAARAAYQHVATVAPYATIVAYKIAWSHWRAGDMAAAARAFDAFLARPEPDAASLMPEARQYLALALVEADQDGDGVPDSTASDATSASVARALAYGRGHAGLPGRAVVVLAADALVDEARYAEAEAIYDQLLAGDLTTDERARVEASRRGVQDLRR
ncbi:MAG: tetratricopeptide repeat protein [Myxococcales bacterium]|nr:tetratricopeptide repeat protein [Myxococcales bacterium]